MGYHITLSRPESQEGITEQEWRAFVRMRPELTIVEDSAFDTVIIDGDMNLALHYVNGSVFTKNPDGPRIIRYMVSIAPHLGGVVNGDEGESFATEADCGTESDWGSPSLSLPLWKRELPRGMRLVVGVLIGVALFGIAELFKTK
jgi:hypothetical protein